MKREHYVLGFIFNRKNDNVLLQQASCPWMEKRWNSIGGHIEKNELPHHAMIREANKEVGMSCACVWIHRITMICPGGTVFIFARTVMTYSTLNLKLSKQETKVVLLRDLSSLTHCMNNIKWRIPLCLENLKHPVKIHTTSLGV